MLIGIEDSVSAKTARVANHHFARDGQPASFLESTLVTATQWALAVGIFFASVGNTSAHNQEPNLQDGQ